MSKLKKIEKEQSIKVIKKEQFKGGRTGNYSQRENRTCPPPFEPDWKKTNKEG